jgi:hypothetical protein
VIDTSVPYSDGWWLKRLYDQLRVQQKRCQALQSRYEGNAPLPFVSDIQNAVKWFVEKSRTNFERVIVNAVLSRLRIRGIRTAVDSDEGGDAEAFTTWRKAAGQAVHPRRAQDGAGDVDGVRDRRQGRRRQPARHRRGPAARHGDHRPGEPVQGAGRAEAVPRRRRRRGRRLPVPARPADGREEAPQARPGLDRTSGSTRAFVLGPRHPQRRSASSSTRARPATIDWLAETDDDGNVTGRRVPVVPFVNEDGMAEFEPFLPQIDRINQQILQRMTIATIQAFKQRAFKGLPKTDPDTGEDIDYDSIFVADPGASGTSRDREIWESGQVDLTGILPRSATT